MAHLALALLGPFEANIDGQPAGGLNSDRLRALLAYPAVESERSHRREALAALLWDGYPQRDTQRSLSQALTNLCSLLSVQAPADPSSEPLLSITGQSIQLQLDSEARVGGRPCLRFAAGGCRSPARLGAGEA